MIEYRLKVLQSVIPILFLIVTIRLFYWQIIRGEELTGKAISQYQSITTLSARRGDIFADDGSILAGSETRHLLYAYKPQLAISTSQVSDQIIPIILQETPITSSSAELISTPEEAKQDLQEYLQERLSKDSSWILLKHYLSNDQKEQIENLKIEGLGFQEEIIRFYPEASMSAHLLGFVGQDINGQPQGYFGLEGFYNRQLQGRAGEVKQETDASGNPILIGDFTQFAQQNGRSLHTTINRSIQFQVEKILKEGLKKYGAIQGTVIVMESKTGAIKALAGLPRYDPRIFYKFSPTIHKNPTVANLFEPGSIFKPLVMAAALNEGVIEPNTKCDICAAPLDIGKYTIKTWNDEYNENVTMTDTIVHSDNIGMVFVARKLGTEKFHQYLEKFGFGKKTGIDLQEEVSGQLRAEKKIKDIDLATMSFGQGIALTRIQIITAINALANNGVLQDPFLVKAIQNGDQIVPVKLKSGTRVISPETSAQITQIMVQAVEAGEAKWAKPKDIQIAGKTGTAQIPISGQYDEDKTIASFVGFFPASNPQYTMLVTLREPTSSPWGSETAAPLWFNIAKQIILLN